MQKKFVLASPRGNVSYYSPFCGQKTDKNGQKRTNSDINGQKRTLRFTDVLSLHCDSEKHPEYEKRG